MNKTFPSLLLALLAAAPLGAAQLVLVQSGFWDGSARSASASFVLEQSTGFPFAGISSTAGYCLAGGFYPIGITASGVATGGRQGAGPALPEALTLNRPSPNPGLRPLVRFGLPGQATISLRVYNILGQEVAVLADGIRPAGWHAVNWSGQDKNGRAAANGMYLLRLTAAGKSLTQKMTIIR
jgi:hypothetical protein